MARDDGEGGSRPRRGRWVRRLVIYLVLIPVLVLAGLWTAGYFLQGSMIYPRSFAGAPQIEGPPLRDAEVWWIDTEDGERVEAWWMPAVQKLTKGPMPVVVFFHGNGELIEHSLDLARFYLALEMHVAFLEYRGYGRSGGAPSQDAIVRDARALVDRIAATRSADASRLVFHGRSLGGGVAAALSERVTPRAMVLESTFTSMTSMTARYFLPAFLCTNPYRTDAALRKFNGPVLILHGERDSIVPVSHAHALGSCGSGCKVVTVDADHNDLGSNWKWYTTTIAEFLRDSGVIEFTVPPHKQP